MRAKEVLQKWTGSESRRRGRVRASLSFTLGRRHGKDLLLAKSVIARNYSWLRYSRSSS